MAECVGIDTNVLVRYLTQDDAKQAQAAALFLEALSVERRGFVSNIVVVELIWVLSRTYKEPRQAIAAILTELFSMPVLVFESPVLLHEALVAYRQSTADFSDLLIQASAHAAGCAYTVTFDQNACAQAGMRLLPAGA